MNTATYVRVALVVLGMVAAYLSAHPDTTVGYGIHARTRPRHPATRVQRIAPLVFGGLFALYGVMGWTH